MHAGRSFVVRAQLCGRLSVGELGRLNFGYECCVGQPRADGAGDIQRRGASGDFFGASVRKRDLNVGLGHKGLRNTAIFGYDLILESSEAINRGSNCGLAVTKFRTRT